MDIINKIHRIVEKMKEQMLAKGIDSLDKVFIVIAQFDKEKTGKLDILQFEPFLAKIGIFLKTQELTEIHKFLETVETGCVSFERFIGLLKCEVPELLTKKVTEIFNKIKDSENEISLNNLYAKFNPERHPRVLTMEKEVPTVQNEFNIAVQFVVGDKNSINLDEFLELHRNMFWVNPKENTTYFYNMLNEIWRC